MVGQKFHLFICLLLFSPETISGMTYSASVQCGCILDCVNQMDGNYQSCLVCDQYIQCQGEMVVAEPSCPAGEIWDDVAKTCQTSSNTCFPPTPPGTTAINTITTTPTQDNQAPNFCSGLADGNYPSELGYCNVFRTCLNGQDTYHGACLTHPEVFSTMTNQCGPSFAPCNMVPTTEGQIGDWPCINDLTGAVCTGANDGEKFAFCAMDCHKYAECEAGVAVMKLCLTSENWSWRHQSCIPKSVEMECVDPSYVALGGDGGWGFK